MQIPSPGAAQPVSQGLTLAEHALRSLKGRLRYADATAILHATEVDTGPDGLLVVVGDPECGAYEWALLLGEGPAQRVEQHSNVGYGMPAVALRDGLIVAYGLPPAPIEPVIVKPGLRGAA